MKLKNVTVDEYELIWDRVAIVMTRYAKARGFQKFRDFEVYVPYNGWSQVLIEMRTLEMLSARLVSKLRRQLKGHFGWEIVVAIAIEKHWNEWPRMGIRIRSHEVVDDLRRDFLPIQFRNLSFEGARVGTPADRE